MSRFHSRITSVMLIVVLYFLVQANVVIAGRVPRNATWPGASISALHVSGTHILNASNKTVTLKGADRFSLEFLCNGDGHFTLADFQAMKRLWHVNVVRFPLDAPYWFNQDGTCSTYQGTVATAVSNAEAAGLYVILDLHRINPCFDPKHPKIHPVPGQQYPMPDPGVNPMWQTLAQNYAADPHIIYDVYNEPFNNLDDSDWLIGANSITYTPPKEPPCTYIDEGMQQLVNVIEKVPATVTHVILVGGEESGYRLKQVLNGYAVSGANVVYDSHLYNFADKTPQFWNGDIGYVANTYPVVADEFGQVSDNSQPECPYVYDVMRYMSDLQTGYLAWVWTTDTGQLQHLLSDWSGTPSTYGQPIHDYMIGKPDSSCEQIGSITTSFGTGSALPSSVSPGQPITFTINFATNYNTPGAVVYNIYNSVSHKVGTVSWQHLFLTTQSQAYVHQWKVPKSLPAGTYTLNIVVTSTDGKQNWGTDNAVASFTVV